jgi:hypothetical protein
VAVVVEAAAARPVGLVVARACSHRRRLALALPDRGQTADWATTRAPVVVVVVGPVLLVATLQQVLLVPAATG